MYVANMGNLGLLLVSLLLIVSFVNLFILVHSYKEIPIHI